VRPLSSLAGRAARAPACGDSIAADRSRRWRVDALQSGSSLLHPPCSGLKACLAVSLLYCLKLLLLDVEVLQTLAVFRRTPLVAERSAMLLTFRLGRLLGSGFLGCSLLLRRTGSKQCGGGPLILFSAPPERGDGVVVRRRRSWSSARDDAGLARTAPRSDQARVPLSTADAPVRICIAP
jgi:hypothetical protein